MSFDFSKAASAKIEPARIDISPPTTTAPPQPTASSPAPAAPSTLDTAKLLQTLLLVQQEFQAKQGQTQQQMARLVRQSADKDEQLAQLQAALDGVRGECAVKDERMREMERERAEWLDVLLCVKAMHAGMVDKLEAIKKRKVGRLADVARGRARVV